jgi:hypothetical protein
LEVVVALKVLVGDLKWAVNAVEGEVEEEGFALGVGLDEAAGFTGEEFGAVAFFFEGLVVVLPVVFAVALVGVVVDGAEVMAMLLVESAGEGKIAGLILAKVPFADDGALIANAAKGLGEGAFGQG